MPPFIAAGETRADRTPATRLVPYTDADGTDHWVEMEGDSAAALELFDRGMRRRAKLFRDNHVRATDVAARRDREERPRKDRSTALLVGYLNYDLEPANVYVKRGDTYPWEGPHMGFTWLIGLSPTWDGPAARVTVNVVVKRRGVKTVEKSTYGVEAVSPAKCRRCRGMAVEPHAVCLDCNRSGREAEIYGTNKAGKGVGNMTRIEHLISPELRKAVSRIIDPAYVPQWLENPNPMFKGATPARLIAEGKEALIWAAVERVQSGDPS